MAFQSCPEMVEVQWRYTMHGVAMQNRIVVNVGESPTQGICDQLAEQAWEAWSDNLETVSATQLFLVETYARDLEHEAGYEASWQPGESPLAGDKAEVVEDNQSCLVIRFDGGLTGRSTRGRVYYPSCTSSDVATGLYNGTRLAEYLLAWVDTIADTVFDVGVHVILSRVANGVLRAVGVDFPVQGYGADFFIGSQRNRRPGLPS